LFNKVCYDSCPLFTVSDESNNICLYEYSDEDTRYIKSESNNSDKNLLTNSIDFTSDYQTNDKLIPSNIFENEQNIYDLLNKILKEKINNNINFVENIQSIFSNN